MGSYQRKEKGFDSERWWISSIFIPLVAPLITKEITQNSLIMDIVRKVYLTQQEMLKFIKKKRQDSLSPNLRNSYEAKQEVNDWLEKDDVSKDTKATIYAQQL